MPSGASCPGGPDAQRPAITDEDLWNYHCELLRSYLGVADFEAIGIRDRACSGLADIATREILRRAGAPI